MRRGFATVVAACVALSGCSFAVSGYPPERDAGVNDVVDGAADTGTNAALDLANAPAFVPSHVSPSAVLPGAASLASVHVIDTELLQLDGKAPPPGVIFVAEPTNDAWAVLSVHDLTLMSDVVVRGRRALVVVAVGKIVVGGKLLGGAQQRAPGPGGQFTGMGRGSDGKSSGVNDSGGGGAGHGTLGGTGGASAATSNGEGGAAGISYEDELAAGSGGGNGAGTMAVNPCPPDEAWSQGGAGGGTIQLSSAVSIDVLFGGAIDTGGGGGRGGCKESASAGGGGGSGGTIWLEAPAMNLAGRLTANGGGGGSGGRVQGTNSDDGLDGADGLVDQLPTQGGASVGTASGAGGAGGSLGHDPQPGSKETNGGGGGGAVGRIRIRTRAVSPITSANTIVSPAPMRSVDF